MSNQEHGSQWSLLGKKNFAPLFWTQFFGAFNDNLFKNALIILLAFNTALLPSGMSSVIAVNLSAGLFILPFFLFSAWAGELADSHEKSRMIQYLKILEIGIALVATAGFFFQSIYCLWLALFALGVQATFFGPLKYSILPQHLKEKELIGGNALIESGTFIAILIGTLMGGILIALHSGWQWVSALALICALTGYFVARKIPLAQAVAPDLKVGFNIWKQSVQTLKIAKEKRSVFLSILGISWFWFFGATMLAQFPTLVKNVIGAQESVVTLFLALFSIGTGVGSLLCEKMSGKKVEIGLVPFGAFGLSFFAFVLYYHLHQYHTLDNATLAMFVASSGAYMIMADLFLLSVFGGFFIVPLYALIQSRSDQQVRSRVIAANNIMNSIFMVASALFAIALVSAGFSIVSIVLALAILNTIVSIYIFTLVPEFLMRFIVWLLIHTIYSMKKDNLEALPEEGAAILVCNHVSFMDALMIFGCAPRPVKFVMYYKIFNIPFFSFMFKAVGAIPIASKNENAEVLEKAYEKMEQYLKDGEIVVIFPEGKITTTGDLNEFRPGLMKVLKNYPVPVIASALSGLWGSMFSRKDKSVWRYVPRGFFNSRVGFHVGKTFKPEEVSMQQLHEEVLRLRGTTK
jgi:1-acyl-sn-glycerol-3-phosphate acyltransferase